MRFGVFMLVVIFLIRLRTGCATAMADEVNYLLVHRAFGVSFRMEAGMIASSSPFVISTIFWRRMAGSRPLTSEQATRSSMSGTETTNTRQARRCRAIVGWGLRCWNTGLVGLYAIPKSIVTP